MKGKLNMKLKDISKNIHRFNSNRAIDIFEKNIELSIKKTVKDNIQYYYFKEYAKKFIK